MQRIFLLSFVLLVGCFSGSWTHGVPAAAPAVVCNLLTGVATGIGAGTCIASPATCNGSDDTAAINSAASWMVNTWQASHVGQIELFIPPGANCSLTTSAITFAGVKKLIVIGYGTRLDGSYFHLGGGGQFQDNLHSTRLQTVTAGATSVTVNPGSASQPAACSTLADCAGLFTAGQYALISGIDLQPSLSFPTNPFYFQYVLITNVNTSTGVVTFTPPLTSTYKSTWPNYSTGGAFNPDHGGPATLYAFNTTWDIEVEYRGLTFTTSNAVDVNGRSAIFRDFSWTFSGQGCLTPTMNQTIQLFSGSMPGCTMEVDKLIETMSINSTTLNVLVFQSSGGSKHFNLNNSNIGAIIGTPQNAVLTNSVITSLDIGPNGYGRADSVAVSNTSVGSITSGGGFHFSGSLTEGVNNISGASMSGGTITIPNAYIIANAGGVPPISWAVPGSNLCWRDNNYACATVWQITDITQDATNTYIATSQSGGFPSWTFSGVLGIQTHPAPIATFTNVTGNVDVVDLSGAPAAAPLWSYSKRTWNNASAGGANATVWGNISNINATVTAAYAGATSPATDNIRPNDAINPTTFAAANYTTANVNLRVASVTPRALATGGGFPAAWTGVQSGDTLPNLTQQTWIANVFDNILTDLSGDPSHQYSATVEVITNQGVVLPP